MGEEGKKKKGELAIRKEQLPVGLDMETYTAMLKENLEGIERPEFPLIKILHAGALAFQMPPDEDGEVKQIKEFSAQLLLHQRVNALWEKSFAETGGGVPPDCSSFNGIKGGKGECRNCKLNQFGSEIKDGEKGLGKACKNMMRLYLRIGKDLLPSLLVVPPTSLREYSAYAVKLTQKGKPVVLVETKFSLTSAQNKQGIKYSKLNCSIVKDLPEKEFKEGLAMRELFMETMKQRPIDVAEEGDPSFNYGENKE